MQSIKHICENIVLTYNFLPSISELSRCSNVHLVYVVFIFVFYLSACGQCSVTGKSEFDLGQVFAVICLLSILIVCVCLTI